MRATLFLPLLSKLAEFSPNNFKIYKNWNKQCPWNMTDEAIFYGQVLPKDHSCFLSNQKRNIKS